MDPWSFFYSGQRSRRQSSKRSHHNRHRHNSSHLSIQLYSSHQRNDSWHSTNTWTGCCYLQTSKGFLRCQTNQQQKRWRPDCLPTIRSPSFSLAILTPTWSCTGPHLSELPASRTWSCSLAPRLSSFAIRETTSVWVPSRVIRVACHPTWGCSVMRKEDPGRPWRLTQ